VYFSSGFTRRSWYVVLNYLKDFYNFSGWTHIDFVSLDTETTEPHILISFPWDTVTVDYFIIERITWGKDELNAQKLSFLKIFMPLMGYKHLEYIRNLDDIFVRNDLII
jgi:hypothetical protein